MSIQQLRPGEKQILEVLREHEPLSNGEIIQKTNLGKAIVCRYIQNLSSKGEIERASQAKRPDEKSSKIWRKYRLTDKGKEMLNTQDDISIICRNKKLGRVELPPQWKRTDVELGVVVKELPSSPIMLPVEVATYLSPVLEEEVWTWQQIRNKLTGRSEDKSEVMETLFRTFATPAAEYFEYQFFRRFEEFAKDLFSYRVQQANQKERKKLIFRQRVDLTARQLIDPYNPHLDLHRFEQELFQKRFPEGEPQLPFETLLDFETALVIRISRDMMKRNAENIRKRLRLLLLCRKLKNEAPLDGLRAMTKTGLMTEEEYNEYEQARGQKKIRVLERLIKETRKSIPNWKSENHSAVISLEP